MVDCAIFMYANENLNLFYNMLFHNYTLNPITPGGGGVYLKKPSPNRVNPTLVLT